MVRWETTRTSRKSQTDKSYQAPTSHIGKPTGLEHFSDPPILDCLVSGVEIVSQDQTPSVNHHLSLKRCQFYTRDTLYGSLGYCCFIEFNILIFIMICRQKRKILNEGRGPSLQPAPSQAKPPPRIIRKPKTMGHALNTSKRKKGML